MGSIGNSGNSNNSNNSEKSLGFQYHMVQSTGNVEIQEKPPPFIEKQDSFAAAFPSFNYENPFDPRNHIQSPDYVPRSFPSSQQDMEPPLINLEDSAEDEGGNEQNEHPQDRRGRDRNETNLPKNQGRVFIFRPSYQILEHHLTPDEIMLVNSQFSKTQRYLLQGDQYLFSYLIIISSKANKDNVFTYVQNSVNRKLEKQKKSQKRKNQQKFIGQVEKRLLAFIDAIAKMKSLDFRCGQRQFVKQLCEIVRDYLNKGGNPRNRNKLMERLDKVFQAVHSDVRRLSARQD